MTGERDVRARAKLGRVRRRIDRWRWTRARRSPMPQELWVAATELAREPGTYQVARELRVGYGSLKDRVGAHGQSSAREAGGFVEVAGASLLSTVSGPNEVELSDANGMKVGDPARGGSGGGCGCPTRGVLGPNMIQITPQMRILVGVEPADFRCGIDGLAQRCRKVLYADPFSGTAFVFRNLRRKRVTLCISPSNPGKPRGLVAL